jgi:hypothetical protein
MFAKQARIMTTTLLLGALLTSAGCGLVQMEGEYYAWAPALEVGTSKDPAGTNAETDLEADIDTENMVTGFTAGGHLGFLGLMIDAFEMDFTGENTVVNPFTFDNVPYANGDLVVSEVSMTLTRFNFEIGGKLPVLPLRVYAIVGIDNIDLDMNVINQTLRDAPAAGPVDFEGTLADNIPLISIGGRAVLRVGPLEVYGRGQGIYSEWVAPVADWFSDVEDITGFYFDASAGVRYWIGDTKVAIGAGYRYFTIDFEFNDPIEQADVLIHGPQLTLAAELP